MEEQEYHYEIYNPLEDPEIKNFFTLTEKLSSASALTKSTAVKLDVYFQNYDDMREKLGILINTYIDEPEIVSKLFDLNDKMEEIIAKYQKNGDLFAAPIAEVETGTDEEKSANSDSSMEAKETSPLEKVQEIETTVIPPQKEEVEVVPAPDPRNTEEFECPICMDTVSPGEGFVIPDCKHSYCETCLKGYCNTHIKEGRVLDLGCPYPKCPTRLGYYEIKNFVDSETFSKYEEFTFLMALKSDPNAKWCPNPKGCGNAIIFEDNTTNKVVCNKCKFEFCKDCMADYHTGTCEEYETWKVENGKADKEFASWVKKNELKKCPKCKIKIQKNEGCNHMTCTSCSFQFCWLCEGKYTSNHYSKLNPLGCPGLQFQNDKKWSKPKLIAMKAGIGTGIILSLPLIIPAAIIGGPLYGGYRLHRWRKHGY